MGLNHLCVTKKQPPSTNGLRVRLVPSLFDEMTEDITLWKGISSGDADF